MSMSGRLHVMSRTLGILRVAVFVLVLAGGGQMGSPATAAVPVTPSPTAIPVLTHIHGERFSGGAGTYQQVAAFDGDRITAASVPPFLPPTRPLPPVTPPRCANLPT